MPDELEQKIAHLDGTFEVSIEDESLFMQQFTSYLSEHLESERKKVRIDLARVQALPRPMAEALETAARVAKGVDKSFEVLVSPELKKRLEEMGVADRIPLQVARTTPESAAAFLLKDNKLVAVSTDEDHVVAKFPEEFERLLAHPGPGVVLDLGALDEVSVYFCNLIAVSVLQAREAGKEVVVKVRPELEKAFRGSAGGALLNLLIEGAAGQAEVYREIQSAKESMDAIGMKRLLAESNERAERDKEKEKATTGKKRREVVEPGFRMVGSLIKEQPRPKKETKREEPERRGAYRFKVEGAYVVWKDRRYGGGEGAQTRSIVIDMSKKGAQFYSNRPLANSTEVEIALCAPAFLQTLRLTGKVMRCEKADHQGKVLYRIGLSFIQVPGGAFLELSRVERKTAKIERQSPP
ncbi:MAG: PilZ domain-containing protein [Planctomycetes bacterium]|nr:PilZ domain-containing protein [Planctomycetota bacterium]